MGIIQLRAAEINAPLVPATCPAEGASDATIGLARLTRRGLLWTAGGAMAAGAALATGLLAARPAYAQSSYSPKPIPGGSPAIKEMGGGQLYHVFGPGPEGAGLDPIDAEPATITDFRGSVGLAYLNGTVTRTNITTSEVRTLSMISSDMRFMKGQYRTTDGQIREGAFAFV